MCGWVALRWLLCRRTLDLGARSHAYYLGSGRLLLALLARSSRDALAPMMACTTARCGAARGMPRAAAVRSIVTALAHRGLGLMLYAGARRGAVRCAAWPAEGGGCEAATVLARRGLRWLVGWRAPRCGAGWRDCYRGRRL